MFEDIGKKTSVADLITKARKITNFIYNHSWLLTHMRKVCGGDIVRPGATKICNQLYSPRQSFEKESKLEESVYQ